MAIVRKDQHGLFVKTDGSIFRPICGQFTERHAVVSETKYREGDRVTANHIRSSTIATIGDEYWSSHGCYYDRNGAQIQSHLIFNPKR